MATVIGDLLQEDAINGDALADAAADYPTVVAQRTGYVVETWPERWMCRSSSTGSSNSSTTRPTPCLIPYNHAPASAKPAGA